jgi:hypothetical protein
MAVLTARRDYKRWPPLSLLLLATAPATHCSLFLVWPCQSCPIPSRSHQPNLNYLGREAAIGLPPAPRHTRLAKSGRLEPIAAAVLSYRLESHSLPPEPASNLRLFVDLLP